MQAIPFTPSIAQPVPGIDCLALGGDRGVDPVGDAALAGECLQQLRPLTLIGPLGDPQRSFEVCRRFTVRSQRGGMITRPGRELEHRIGIAGIHGVPRKPRGVHLRGSGTKNRHSASVQPDPFSGVERLGEGSLGKIVAEAQHSLVVGEHSARSALLDGSVVALRDLSEQLRLPT
jgi:hypothetical protein